MTTHRLSFSVFRHLSWLLLALLFACSTRPPSSLTPAEEGELPWQAVWQADSGRYNAATAQLIRQADNAIRNRNTDKAGSLLERALRIDNRIAGIWSRLGWLAMQNHQYRRAQNLLQRSNSLGPPRAMRRLNWQFYLRASEAAGDAAGVARARQKLTAFDG